MATITLSTGNKTATVDLPNMTDADVEDFMLAMAKNTGYEEQIRNTRQEDGTLIDPNSTEEALIDNPKSTLQYATEQTVEFWGNNVRAIRSRQAQEQARVNANQAVDNKTTGWTVTES